MRIYSVGEHVACVCKIMSPILHLGSMGCLQIGQTIPSKGDDCNYHHCNGFTLVCVRADVHLCSKPTIEHHLSHTVRHIGTASENIS